MFHSQPLDWEVVESHTVAPVQVLFTDDGVKIHQIAPNEISGSYTFDMHPSRHPSSFPSPPPSPPLKNVALKEGPLRPVSDPGAITTTSRGTASLSAKKLHRRSRRAEPSPSTTRGVSNPFTFGILKQTTSPATTPSRRAPVSVSAPGPKPERPRSFGTTFSFLYPRHGRDRSGSASSSKSGASTSGTDDGEISKSRSAPELVPTTQKETQAHPRTAPTPRSTGSYSPTLPSQPHSPFDPPTPVAVVPPSSPSQLSYDKAQTKKVLKHARAELMKQVGKAGYNVLVVEGWELTVLRQHERYRVKVVYRARAAIAEPGSVEREGALIPRSPPYLAMLDA